MAKYKIPDDALPGFLQLAQFPDAYFGSILNILRNVNEETDQSDLLREISEVSNIENEDEESFLGPIILNIASLLSDSMEDKDVLISDFLRSFKLKYKDKDSETVAVLETRLKNILEHIHPLIFYFKIQKLLMENENVYSSSTIASDIRLVFNEQISDPKRKGLIIHRLRVEHFTNGGGDKKELFFSLDKDDLLAMRKVIDRALEKEDTLKNTYSQSIEFYKRKN